MEGSSRLGRQRRHPRGLIGMIALVGTIELYVALQGDRFVGDAAANWAYKGAAASREAKGCGVLGFGDSQVEFGLWPGAIVGRTGRRAYNLAMHAGPPSASYYLLRRALAAGARPGAVVVDFLPHQLAMGPGDPGQRDLWPALVGPSEALDLAWQADDPGLFGATVLAGSLPTVRSRREVRACLLAALRGESFSARYINRSLRRNWDRNDGAQVMPANDRFGGGVDPNNVGLFPPSWSPDPATVGYVRRFLRLARSRGIAVAWLVPPISPASQALRDRMGLDAAYTRFVRGMQAEFPGVVVLDARHSGYGAEVFVDANHLDRRGAAALSDDVAAALAGLDSGPGWVELPRYRERGAPVAMEDLAQSRAALRLASGRKKGRF